MLTKEYLDNQNALAVDASADPYAGTTAPNGKDIWSPQEAADNLMRHGVDFTHGNYGALDDGVLTYGFWTFEQFLESYYYELRYSNGEAFNDDAYYAEAFGAFEEFNALQKAAAAATIQLWDDLIAVEFEAVEAGEVGDIMFGAVYMSPAAGAHAYYPQAEALDYVYGTEAYGQISGDVMINWYYNQTDFADMDPGSYGWFTLAHELGHSLGLAHGGDYNASDDNDGDGEPDPITYAGDAYFFQDSHQYTIMSYFSGRATGQAAVQWTATGGLFAYAQTPAVHDVLAAQNTYGADMTTRTGDTVYGFNSNADRDVFDFTVNEVPIVTIWDAGGNDTLDLSGFDSDSVININEGAFSSAGYKINAESLAYWASQGLDTEEELAGFFARNGVGPDGQPIDNIAIAYGAQIENAVGGVGNDTMIGNALGNRLEGGAGNDVIAGNDGEDQLLGGDGDDVLIGGAGQDYLTGGAGSDLFVFAETDSVDIIRDFESGSDMIDLSAFGIDSGDVKIAGRSLRADTDGDGKHDLHIVVQGDKLTLSDIDFGDSGFNSAAYAVSEVEYMLIV